MCFELNISNQFAFIKIYLKPFYLTIYRIVVLCIVTATEKGERKIFPERNFRKMRSDEKIFRDGKINVCT